VRRWIWVTAGIALSLIFGASYVLLQLTILQPPVLEPNILEKRLARAYRETATIQPITGLPVIRVGDAALFHKAAPGSRPVVLLPDLGGGAWVFEKFLSAWQGVDAYALSYRGGFGANPVNAAGLEDYVKDASAALESVAQRTGQTPVLLGQGMGALIAMRIAQETPQRIGGLVLIAPYVPRDWSDQQLWLARTIGNWAYSAAYAGGQAARDFWVANFPSGFLQSQLAVQALNQYALQRVPFETKGVIQDVNFTRLAWLDKAYSSLENAKFNVLHVIARYDTTNPMGAQRELRTQLQAGLGARYRVVILNSARFVSLDWKWSQAANAAQSFVKDGQLKANIIENQAVLDPVTEPPPDR
jgi:pimeloyl-ACP methyl ester carboxylesterase